MIPKVLHQTWKSTDIPPHLRGFRDSWLRYHPGWEYRFWNDQANEALIADHYAALLGDYRRLQPTILKLDFVRLAYLHRFGGVYADLDYEVVRPLDDLLETSHALVGREHDGIGRPMRGRDYVINALLASPAGHPLWLEVMHGMVRGYRARRIFERSTRYVIRMAIDVLDRHVERRVSQEGDVVVLPYHEVYPSTPTRRITEERRRDAVALGSYGVHHYDNSWRSPLAKLANHGRLVVQHCLP